MSGPGTTRTQAGADLPRGDLIEERHGREIFRQRLQVGGERAVATAVLGRHQEGHRETRRTIATHLGPQSTSSVSRKPPPKVVRSVWLSGNPRGAVGAHPAAGPPPPRLSCAAAGPKASPRPATHWQSSCGHLRGSGTDTNGRNVRQHASQQNLAPTEWPNLRACWQRPKQFQRFVHLSSMAPSPFHKQLPCHWQVSGAHGSIRLGASHGNGAPLQQVQCVLVCTVQASDII